MLDLPGIWGMVSIKARAVLCQRPPWQFMTGYLVQSRHLAERPGREPSGSRARSSGGCFPCAVLKSGGGERQCAGLQSCSRDHGHDLPCHRKCFANRVDCRGGDCNVVYDPVELVLEVAEVLDR